MSAQPALVSRATFTKEKIALLCLMNMVFERPSQDRNIPFEEIATRTKLPVDEVGDGLLLSVLALCRSKQRCSKEQIARNCAERGDLKV